MALAPTHLQMSPGLRQVLAGPPDHPCGGESYRCLLHGVVGDLRRPRLGRRAVGWRDNLGAALGHEPRPAVQHLPRPRGRRQRQVGLGRRVCRHKQAFDVHCRGRGRHRRSRYEYVNVARRLLFCALLATLHVPRTAESGKVDRRTIGCPRSGPNESTSHPTARPPTWPIDRPIDCQTGRPTDLFRKRLPGFGQSWGGFDPSWPDVGQLRAGFGQVWSSVAKCEPVSTRHGQL